MFSTMIVCASSARLAKSSGWRWRAASADIQSERMRVKKSIARMPAADGSMKSQLPDTMQMPAAAVRRIRRFMYSGYPDQGR